MSLCFYFPYHEDSGVPVLFYRMANFIAKKYPEIMIYVVDYIDGVMARHLLKIKNLILIPFYDGVKCDIPPETVLIMQSFAPYYWPVELQLDDKTRLFFWNLHPRNFVPSLLPFPGLRELPTTYYWIYKLLAFFYHSFLRKFRKYVELLMSARSVVFMDSTNYESVVKYLFLQADNKTEFIPVPVTIDETLPINREKPNYGKLRLCWVGRLCDYKSYILVYTINKIIGIANQIDRNFVYYIIGDGPFLKYIQKNILYSDRVDVIFCGAIPHNELDDFLNQNVDVMTAMGTSALEGAKLHIPAILLDFSFKKIRGDYKYRFLYETKYYDLGHQIDKDDYLTNNESLKTIILSLLNEYDVCADKTYEYFKSNHSINSVVEKFILQIFNSKLIYGMLDKSFIKKNIFLIIYNKLRGLKT